MTLRQTIKNAIQVAINQLIDVPAAFADGKCRAAMQAAQRARGIGVQGFQTMNPALSHQAL